MLEAVEKGFSLVDIAIENLNLQFLWHLKIRISIVSIVLLSVLGIEQVLYVLCLEYN
jgi:hypothetical protein